jgi:energy-coupling factor transporter transmembrane protein EcfT
MRDPRPPLLVATGLIAAALASGQPLVVGGALVGAVLLLLAAPGTHRMLLSIAAASGLLVWLLNPLVAAEGQQVLVAGSHHLLIDFEVTAEELIHGFASGARLATAILAIGAFLALADPDRLHAMTSRIVPRSTLTVALAARLAPALRRDATAMREALVLRGIGPADGRVARLRQAGALVEPLVAASLERGVEASEAMAARGFGLVAPSRLPEPPLTRGERIALGLGALAAAVAIVAVLGGIPYATYPVADPIWSISAAALGLGLATVGLLAGRLLGDRA